MKRIIYYICSILSLCIFLYMLYICYRIFAGLHSGYNVYDSIAWCLATLGWGHITYNVITRKYAWLKNLCK